MINQYLLTIHKLENELPFGAVFFAISKPDASSVRKYHTPANDTRHIKAGKRYIKEYWRIRKGKKGILKNIER